VGQTLGPLRWAVPAEVQAARLAALEATHPCLRGDAPGGPLLLPVFLEDLYYALAETRWDWGLPVAAKLEVESVRPCPAGATVWGTLRVVDRYERRGGRYVATELEVTDEAGAPLARLRNVTLLNPDAVYRRRAAAGP
jgi:hypothetical protein